jgi:hypothetical protein
MSTSSDNVKRFWLDLNKGKKNHGTIFALAGLQSFIKEIINNLVPAEELLSNTAPISDSDRKLIFILHSPLSLELTDGAGDFTGLNNDESVSEEIPGSQYGEFGEVKFVIAPEGPDYSLTMHGQAAGTFSLDVQEMDGDTVTQTDTVANVPTTAETVATLAISESTTSSLIVDEDGDGTADITLPFIADETVSYEPPASDETDSPRSNTSSSFMPGQVMGTSTALLASEPRVPAPLLLVPLHQIVAPTPRETLVITESPVLPPSMSEPKDFKNQAASALLAVPQKSWFGALTYILRLTFGYFLQILYWIWRIL